MGTINYLTYMCPDYKAAETLRMKCNSAGVPKNAIAIEMFNILRSEALFNVIDSDYVEKVKEVCKANPDLYEHVISDTLTEYIKKICENIKNNNK